MLPGGTCEIVCRFLAAGEYQPSGFQCSPHLDSARRNSFLFSLFVGRCVHDPEGRSGHMKSLSLSLIPLLLSSACGGSTSPTFDVAMDAPQADGGGADGRLADLISDLASQTGSDGAATGWGHVESLLISQSAQAGVSNFGLTIWNVNDRKIYEYMAGGFTAGTRVAIASASKLVSTLVIFEVIRRGQLSLDSTTGQVLAWTGPNARITLRHLLSFTSGLQREAPCTLNPLVTLAACVDTIAMTPAISAPGTHFDYGSTHLHVAARMAEVVSGSTWAELFAETLRTPLGLPEDVAYYTFPRQPAGRINPLIAGGIRASSADYAKFLALAFHKGSLGAVTIGTPALFDAQAREPFPDVTIGFSPFVEARYGLGSWLMCDQPAMGCPVVTSPGAFGFTPWLDRDAGYYAIIAMELSNTSNDRPAAFTIKLLQQLQPLIRTQLGR
jgi:D-alanyl-D-alanine-carboxypeptidase/D-alanyl-D-alanine-endopeptidase